MVPDNRCYSQKSSLQNFTCIILVAHVLVCAHGSLILNGEYCSPALLDLFISTNTSICSTMAFPLLGNSGHVVIPVSIDFPINSKQDAPFHCVAYDYFCADCYGLCDHLRDLSLEDIFKLSASAAASELCERVQVGIDLYIFYHKYQVKCHLPPWF